MTTLAFSRGWSRTAATTNPILSLAMGVAGTVRRYLTRREDMRRLQAMPDYLLKDLGISREEIEVATVFGRSRVVHSADWL